MEFTIAKASHDYRGDPYISSQGYASECRNLNQMLHNKSKSNTYKIWEDANVKMISQSAKRSSVLNQDGEKKRKMTVMLEYRTYTEILPIEKQKVEPTIQFRFLLKLNQTDPEKAINN